MSLALLKAKRDYSQKTIEVYILTRAARLSSNYPETQLKNCNTSQLTFKFSQHCFGYGK